MRNVTKSIKKLAIVTPFGTGKFVRHGIHASGLVLQGCRGCGTASMPADWSYRAAGGNRDHVWTYAAHRLLPTRCRKGTKERRKGRKKKGRMKERRKNDELNSNFEL